MMKLYGIKRPDGSIVQEEHLGSDDWLADYITQFLQSDEGMLVGSLDDDFDNPREYISRFGYSVVEVEIVEKKR